jgi:hypothetical protein
MKRILVWLMNTDFWVWALKHVVPYIRFTMYYPSLRGAKYHEGYGRLKAGHILLTNDSKKLTSLLIPGEFSHAALCVDSPWDAESYEIAEMTHTNYTKSYFFDLCKEADRVVILECADWDDAYVEEVTAKCREFEGAAYDVKFELGVKTLYCSELVYQSDFEHRLQVNLEDLAGLGRKYLSPDGIYKAKNVRVVWDSTTSG